MGTDFRINKLDVVTTNAVFLPAKLWREVPLFFPNRRGCESAARSVILWSLSTGQAMNRLCIYKRERLCI
ncbi:hypothetical protein AO401_21770 [Salmonella enterica]|nr:hypothetical protein [Salmonella enterica]EAQ6074478.1 hypothetical protein [Salmonella enterica]EAZ0470804.1 hypothetical protein [Salmonella enterica]EBP7910557.1 hypothetical protein [Salmonella enterica]